MVFHCWTSNVKTDSFHQPRLVYDLQGNIVFVQAIYRCPYKAPDRSSSRHEYLSASTEILTIVPPEIAKQFPFKLFYRSACSQALLDYVIVHIGRGHNFLELAEDIASVNFRAFNRHSNDQLMYIFLAYFNSVESTFENELAMTPCSILTCDHTFKVSKQIGAVRTFDKTFVNQFKNLFIGLNENGQVVNWRLTKSTAFEQIQDLLIDFKSKLDAQSTTLEMIIVDDCCSVRPSYQRIFPDIPVKLDIFHACQRFVKTLPKGFSLRKKLSSEFGLIFRHNNDTGEERTMNTPCPEDIECNMEMLLKRWEGRLSEATLDSVRNLRKHIKKGCCSDIPPRAGTQKNERLHKLLKRSLLGGASVISPELAIAVLSVVMYIWSCKRDPCAYYLTWKDMSTQMGILSVISSTKLWTAPSKEQYLPIYFKTICDEYAASVSPHRVFPVQGLGLQKASGTPTWVFGSNYQVELRDGKARRLLMSESPFCTIGSVETSLPCYDIEGSLDSGEALKK